MATTKTTKVDDPQNVVTMQGGKRKTFRVKKITPEPVQEELPLDTVLPSTTIFSAGVTTTATLAANTVTVAKLTPMKAGKVIGGLSPTYARRLQKPVHVPPAEEEEYSVEELDKKENWTTSEAAWYCGMTRGSWHVRMSTSPVKLYPVSRGRGRGKENVYLAADVKRFLGGKTM